MARGFVNILSIALIYCGAVFGAGFASGREIFSFFSCYKTWGIVSSIFTGFLFSFFGYFICRFSKQKNIKNTQNYLKELFPEPVANFFSAVTNAFLVLSFCIMITGCGTILCEQFKIPGVFAAVFSLSVCFLVIKNRVSGLEAFNFFATPVMIVGVVMLCVLCLKLPKETVVDSEQVFMPFLSGVLYISYNMVSAVTVLVSTASIAKTDKEAARGGALGGILIGIPLVLMSVVLAYHWEVASYPMPFFRLVYSNFSHFSLICTVVLYFAMMTTAMSSGVAVLANVESQKSQKYAILLCFLALLVSFLPFAQLVLSVYSAFGVIGIVLVVRIFIKILRK